MMYMFAYYPVFFAHRIPRLCFAAFHQLPAHCSLLALLTCRPISDYQPFQGLGLDDSIHQHTYKYTHTMKAVAVAAAIAATWLSALRSVAAQALHEPADGRVMFGAWVQTE
jgi:hypothetical protein